MEVFARTFLSRKVLELGLISLSMAAILLHVPWVAETASGEPVHFIIVHTNNVNAHLFGCPT